MVDEFDLIEASIPEEIKKVVPIKAFSPRNYSTEDDSNRSWHSSTTEDSNNIFNYYDDTKTRGYDTALRPSRSLNYSDSCETYKSVSSSFESSSSIYSRPETPYNKFLERLKHPCCADVVSAIKGLVVMLPGNMVRTEVATISHNFIDIYTPKLLSLEIFTDLSDEEKIETVECFEKFTMQKLYPRCYRMDPADIVEDEKLEIQMRCLNWIEPHHLEIHEMGDLDTLKQAQNQLKNLYKYKSPRDKLIIILNFCRLVVYSIQKVTNKEVSCDEAFPLLIFTLILTNPCELHSSIEFIQNFRHPARHVSDEAYAFTLLVSAVEFIRSIGTASQLKINSEDFRKKYLENIDKYHERLVELDGKLPKKLYTTLKDTSLASPTGNMNKDNLMDVLRKFNMSTLFKVPSFKSDKNELFEIIESLEDLESYLTDLPLCYKHSEDNANVSELVGDWRALVAMKNHVTDTIASVKNKAKRLL
ncbi:vacuolar-protein sorting-associated protein [Theileria orientalis]|uniref:Vacuolar-protein sorting-associated protein n=1 Tax=Theileria orientalis TaxID=68886 RepID=A0A976QTI9_THEOR|nr:vacuolar-protein sorting-associated protein [Theileria orientalis]